METDLLTMEEIIDTCSLIYLAPDGKIYDGKCTVTKKNIYYDIKPMGRSLIVNGHSRPTREIKIPKDFIKKVKVKKSFFAKKIIVFMFTGEQHIFSSLDMNTSRIVDAINSR